MTALCLCLAGACVWDYRHGRIPNCLLALTAAAGAAWRFWSGGPPGAVSYAGEGALVIALLYPFFKIGAVGAGDVKLLGVAAGYLPSERVLYFLFFSLLIGAIISLVKMWRDNSFARRWRHLREYLADVAEAGSWRPYLKKEGDGRREGVCMSGPVLAGILLYLGGVY